MQAQRTSLPATIVQPNSECSMFSTQLVNDNPHCATAFSGGGVHEKVKVQCPDGFSAEDVHLAAARLFLKVNQLDGVFSCSGKVDTFRRWTQVHGSATAGDAEDAYQITKTPSQRRRMYYNVTVAGLDVRMHVDELSADQCRQLGLPLTERHLQEQRDLEVANAAPVVLPNPAAFARKPAAPVHVPASWSEALQRLREPEATPTSVVIEDQYDDEVTTPSTGTDLRAFGVVIDPTEFEGNATL